METPRTLLLATAITVGTVGLAQAQGLLDDALGGGNDAGVSETETEEERRRRLREEEERRRADGGGESSGTTEFGYPDRETDGTVATPGDRNANGQDDISEAQGE